MKNGGEFAVAVDIGVFAGERFERVEFGFGGDVNFGPKIDGLTADDERLSGIGQHGRESGRAVLLRHIGDSGPRGGRWSGPLARRS
jgi:hypothetical protein